MQRMHSECIFPRMLSLKLSSISLNGILITLLEYVYIYIYKYIMPLACMQGNPLLTQPSDEYVKKVGFRGGNIYIYIYIFIL